MKCVVLMGFSTTGKTTISKEFQKQYEKRIALQDSDKVISKQEGGHIYNLYLRLRVGGSTQVALRTIDNRERLFLKAAGPSKKPLLLAAGPFLPSREPEWRDFLSRVHPVCLYLQKGPEDVLEGLLYRRRCHLQDRKLAKRPGFGCWDQGITTEFQKDHWVEIDKARALTNIRRVIANMSLPYGLSADQTFTWQERQTPEGKELLDAAIRYGLGL